MNLPGIAWLFVRPRIDDDTNYILHSWKRSYLDAPAMRGIAPDIYYANMDVFIRELWLDGTWLVVHPEHDPTFVVGWMVGEGSDRGPIVHYVYVRHSLRGVRKPATPARRHGIATAMVTAFLDGQDATRVWYTHRTALGDLALSGRCAPQPGAPGWEYNPWLAWRRLERRR